MNDFISYSITNAGEGKKRYAYLFKGSIKGDVLDVVIKLVKHADDLKGYRLNRVTIEPMSKGRYTLVMMNYEKKN